MELPTTAPSTPMLYLRIGQRFLNLLPAATEEQPSPHPMPPLPATTGNLNVIIAPLPDLRPFSGDTVDWLIRVARFIFEPRGTSSLYTFTTGTVESWLEREMMQEQWRMVQDREQLRSTILRRTRSVTTNTSADRGNTFREALLRRHQQCIISPIRLPQLLIASHLIPRRLGDAGVQSVINRFTDVSTLVDRYNPMIGVPLYLSLDVWVNTYRLGFWNCGPHQHVLHNFFDSPLNCTGTPPTNRNEPLVHGHQITLTSHDPALPLPPVGVLNWHYVQDDIDDDESDRDFDDERNIANPPYPSYLLELSEARARQRLEEEECRHAILTWNSS